MNPEDDPEARIRALEQPLADTARASELGAAQLGCACRIGQRLLQRPDSGFRVILGVHAQMLPRVLVIWVSSALR